MPVGLAPLPVWSGRVTARWPAILHLQSYYHIYRSSFRADTRFIFTTNLRTGADVWPVKIHLFIDKPYIKYNKSIVDISQLAGTGNVYRWGRCQSCIITDKTLLCNIKSDLKVAESVNWQLSRNKQYKCLLLRLNVRKLMDKFSSTIARQCANWL